MGWIAGWRIIINPHLDATIMYMEPINQEALKWKTSIWYIPHQKHSGSSHQTSTLSQPHLLLPSSPSVRHSLRQRLQHLDSPGHTTGGSSEERGQLARMKQTSEEASETSDHPPAQGEPWPTGPYERVDYSRYTVHGENINYWYHNYKVELWIQHLINEACSFVHALIVDGRKCTIHCGTPKVWRII